MSSDDRARVEKLNTLAASALALQSVPVCAVGGSLLKMLYLLLMSLIERIEKLERAAHEQHG